ncbi:MAG: hypothetical protein ACREPX_12925 [Rhodanobacteraceae bacterium]
MSAAIRFALGSDFGFAFVAADRLVTLFATFFLAGTFDFAAFFVAMSFSAADARK